MSLNHRVEKGHREKMRHGWKRWKEARKRDGKPKKCFCILPAINPTPPHPFSKRRLTRKVQVASLFFLKSPRAVGKNVTPIKMQTPAVLDLTFIYTLIRRNPFNQMI